MNLLGQTAIFLGAAVVAVPLSRKAGLGALLGYLLAGIVIGPHALGLIGGVEDILHFAELGVVLLLFIIGLELKPTRLWAMRKPVFGLGLQQVTVTSALLFGLALWMGMDWKPALVVALSLSLSSTAVALQLLAEKKQLLEAHGRASFGVLLFQDLAIVPFMAIVPLLSDQPGAAQSSMLVSTAIALAAVLAVVIGGHYLLRPVFRIVASSGVHEVFTAAALLIVVGTGLLMQAVGFSMAMGAFLAGVLLADSEYRHELEANIEPFKGLLLGLFFIAVGMTVNLELVLSQTAVVFGLTALLLVTKFGVLWILGRFHGLTGTQATRLGVTIFQGGEFAFVLFGLAQTHNLFDRATADLLILIVSFSMMLTPLIVTACDAVLARTSKTAEPAFDTLENEENSVIIAGFGRFGQIIGRLLQVRRTPFTALDTNSAQVDFVRRFGNKVYYGDPTRVDVLRAAGAAEARILVVALDDMKSANRLVEVASKHFPHLKVFVRARNRQHVFELMDLGATRIWRETFLSSLDMGEGVLRATGVPISVASEIVSRFQNYDRELIKAQHAIHKDNDRLQQSGQRSRQQLEELFERDADELFEEMRKF